MKQEYSIKTKKILKRTDSFLYENGKFIRKTKRFLKNLEDELLISEAEMIVRKYQNKK